METDDKCLKDWLKCRTVGLCMAFNRLLNFHVVRSTVSTQYMWPQYTVDANSRIERKPDHKENVPKYPDAEFYLNEVQYYVFRNVQLRHIRIAQFIRCVSRQEDKFSRPTATMGTGGNTMGEEDEGQWHEAEKIIDRRLV